MYKELPVRPFHCPRVILMKTKVTRPLRFLLYNVPSHITNATKHQFYCHFWNPAHSVIALFNQKVFKKSHFIFDYEFASGPPDPGSYQQAQTETEDEQYCIDWNEYDEIVSNQVRNQPNLSKRPYIDDEGLEASDDSDVAKRTSKKYVQHVVLCPTVIAKTLLMIELNDFVQP